MGKRPYLQSGITLGIVGLAATIFIGMVRTNRGPELTPGTEAIQSVEALRVDPATFTASIVGYGTIRAKRQVQIIPEVGGRLIASHPRLAVGEIISKGELLYEIDPRAYESRVVQMEAEIDRLNAEMKRQRQDHDQLQERLALTSQQAELARRSVEREEQLLKQGSSTQVELEVFQQRLLSHREAVLTYQAQLNAIPILLEETAALRTIKQAQLQEAELSLEKTKIYCPFDASVDHIGAHVPQVVIAGATIAALTDMEAVELSVAVDPLELRWVRDDLFGGGSKDDRSAAAPARVRWAVSGHAHSWLGRVRRVERLDAGTRTAHVIIELDNSPVLTGAVHDYALPAIGMFCRVEIPTRPVPGALVLPRSAIQGGASVYVFEPSGSHAQQGTLRIKHVRPLRQIESEVLVGIEGPAPFALPVPEGLSPAAPADRLQPRDLVITSPLATVIEGMPLRLRPPQLEALPPALHPQGSATVEVALDVGAEEG